MNAACPKCQFSNEARIRYCAKCGSLLTSGVSPWSYLNDGAYDSPLARRVEKEALEGRVHWAVATLVLLGIVQAISLPVYWATHSGPEEEAERILVCPILLLFSLAYIRIAVWSRSQPLPALAVGVALYGLTAAFVIIRAVIGALTYAPDVLQAVIAAIFSFFIIGILLIGVIAAAGLKNWSLLPSENDAPRGYRGVLLKRDIPE